MKIQILGPGCPKCVMLTKNVTKAVDELGMEAEVQKVSGMTKIMEYGVLLTPGLVINGKVVSSGKLLSVEQVKELLSKSL